MTWSSYGVAAVAATVAVAAAVLAGADDGAAAGEAQLAAASSVAQPIAMARIMWSSSTRAVVHQWFEWSNHSSKTCGR